MPTPRALVLRAPGTNCDAETAHAFRLAGAEAQSIHIQRLLAEPALLDACQVLCIAGGFSYGDDLAAGRVLGGQVRLRLADALRRFRDAGKLILGICNGFQVLASTDLLDLEDAHGPLATLTRNDSGRYEARWVHLRTAPSNCVFLAGIDRIELPVAHAEGKFVARDAQTLASLEQGGRLPLRYAAADGGEPCYPANPNGSPAHVAGACDASGRVFGLMPHPERFVDPTQHPEWTRTRSDAAGAGLALFQNAVRYFG
ncbi:Phosphoribosylformylglycinamidine synthase [Pirellulimonas nuda]|uniref:Phosphoribosylformylglycinamidine synthase n=1 Tax=Pirellulimonas nuda TaxID=2528009 RepID=A0A518DBG3_9BACT|nr:phosphoribosylformylglycinamidine synthase I [Pirellulimonas nuda]QDU88786.1 Phosphoribosylformylglycinamidine synthase [Pirellulimonas nuda]